MLARADKCYLRWIRYGPVIHCSSCIFYDGITFSRMRSICGVHGERDALGDDENYMLLLSSPLPTPSSISQNNRSHHDHLCG
jgi:hypothetical protein